MNQTYPSALYITLQQHHVPGTFTYPTPLVYPHAHKPVPHLWNEQQAEDDCYGKEDATCQHPVAGLGLLGEQNTNGDQRDAGQDREVHSQRNAAGIVESLNVNFACLKCEEESHPQVDGLIDEEDRKHNVMGV